MFFVCGIASGDNELITLEIIHRYVEVLDRYFGNVRFCLLCFGIEYSLNEYYLGMRAGPVRFESVVVCETILLTDLYQHLQFPESICGALSTFSDHVVFSYHLADPGRAHNCRRDAGILQEVGAARGQSFVAVTSRQIERMHITGHTVG